MDPTLLLIIGIVGVIGFGVLGFAAFRMMGEEKAGKKDDYKFGEAPPATESRAAPPGSHEVLRVLRDDLTGRMIVEIGGQRFSRIMEIQDPNLGRGLVTTVRDLQKFMQGQTTGSAPPPEVTSPAPVAVSSPTPTPPAPPPPAPPAPEPPRSSSASHPAPPPIAIPSMNPFKQAQVLREMNKQKPPEPKGIAEQIDEVLQEKIAGSPYVRRGLKVQISQAGGVLFMLDGQGYEGVEAVPDPEVQTVIRAAVKEWESRQ